MNKFLKKIIDTKNNTIIYEGTNELSKRVIYPVYSESSDVTVIFEDIFNKNNGKIQFTKIVGFYFGKPNINLIEKYEGKLQASFIK